MAPAKAARPRPTVKLYVCRHAYAGPAVSDPKQERERPLLPEGVATAKAMAKAMGDLGEVPNTIYCSPYARTQQTADIIGKILGVGVNIVGDLSAQRPLENGIRDLISDSTAKRVMLVGHVDNTSPSLNKMGGDVKWKDLVMCEVRRVRMDRKSGEWVLRWSMKPSDIGRPDRKS